MNSAVDAPTARLIIENFVEVVIAPAVDEAALEVFAAKRNLRVLTAPSPR